MSKRFYPESGFMVRNGGYWYDHRVLLTVEEDQRIEIFRRPYAGKPGIRLGSYGYDQLDPQYPPIGLRLVDTPEGMPNPFTVVGGKVA
jgi:hypothetical protein